jgi:diguanylate cyclase (GGDEF)-like protein/PAS domain S-box-containing protein
MNIITSMENFHTLLISIIIIILSILIILLVLLVDRIKTVTRLNKTTVKLKEMKELWKTFYDADASFVYLKDEQLKYVFVNQSLKEFYDLSYREIIGHDDFQLFDQDLAKRIRQTDNSVLKLKKPLEKTILQKGRYYKIKKFPVCIREGHYGIGTYITDITQEYRQQRIRERMLKRNKLLLEVSSRCFKDVHEQLDYVLDELLLITDSSLGSIYFYNHHTEELILSTGKNRAIKDYSSEEFQKNYKLSSSGIWRDVVRRRKPIVINNFNKYERIDGKFLSSTTDLVNFMAIPVVIDGKIEAVLGLGNKPTDYDKTDVGEMKVLMSGVWNAVSRREFNETLAYERNKYYQTLLSIGDGVMVIDSSRNIEFMNPVACRLTGWTLNEAVGKHYSEIFVLAHEHKEHIVSDPIEKVFSTGKTQNIGSHAVLTSKTGEKYNLEDSAASIPDEAGRICGVVLVFKDVTDKMKRQREIEHISTHDSLTGLYNRRFFEEMMSRLDNEENLPLSILMGDVNSLKLTNDIFGHVSGDMLLKKASDAMQNVCRDHDVVARWGGDEFVILLPKAGENEAKETAGKIKYELSKQQIHSVRCSISMGYATKTNKDEDIIQVLHNAEIKMYNIKSVERIETQNTELKTMLNELFMKSEWERQHAVRVREMSVRLGLALNLPKSDIIKLKRAAYLHDIGKAVVGSDILQNDGTFNSAELSNIKLHPAVGYRILSYFDTTLELAGIILSHHETWDGTGYPKGLKEDEIPLEARIISVVEAYDRMMHTIDHTKAKSHNEALDEIQRCAGTQFDPYITAAFVHMFMRYKE